jgi:hypothetical protein
MRASANVIHPRCARLVGNADKERASVASVVPSSFMTSGGAAAVAPDSFLISLIIPSILESPACSIAYLYRDCHSGIHVISPSTKLSYGRVRHDECPVRKNNDVDGEFLAALSRDHVDANVAFDLDRAG